MVALGLQPEVVEPIPHQLGARDVVENVAALGIGVLPVAGDLHLLVADLGEPLKDRFETGRVLGAVWVTTDRVPHAPKSRNDATRAPSWTLSDPSRSCCL